MSCKLQNCVKVNTIAGKKVATGKFYKTLYHLKYPIFNGTNVKFRLGN